MKTSLLAIALLITALATAQGETLTGEKTIVSSPVTVESSIEPEVPATISAPEEMPAVNRIRFSIGGYLSLTNRITNLQGSNGWMTGAGAGIVLNKNVHLGVQGYALLSAIQADFTGTAGEPYYLEFAYGGLYVEPVVWQMRNIAITMPVLVGAGVAGIHDTRLTDPDGWYGNFEDWDIVFVAEPGINMEWSLSRMVKLYAGGYYRFVEDATLTGISGRDLSGFGATFGIRIGWY